ncbi:unnamed protein product [Psylliodes chrysocephalus]|uniref:Phorbol-ester/DAG-type domain-containing protein n=1 Tax=Psylliodes chrysocephalus TaxID=3402493 RepID=A0A9P0CE40_9CUCU|nr:unnamed protein product [Psylliodes chrysocephala]
MNKCKRCGNSVTTGPKCIICGVMSHNSCLKMLKNTIIIDSKTSNCCNMDPVEEPIISLENSSENESVDKIKIKYLEQIIKQNDLVIENQKIAICALQEQINYLKCSNSFDPKSQIPAVTTLQPPANNPNSNSKNMAKISTHAVSLAVHNAQCHAICDRYVNQHTNSLQSEADNVNNYYTSGRSGRRNRNLITGSGITTNCSLKAAIRTVYKHLHVTNMDPATSEQELLTYLKGVVPSIRVEKLNSRFPDDYASFKVSAPINDHHQLLVPEIWPEKVMINEFATSPRFRQQTNNMNNNFRP